MNKALERGAGILLPISSLPSPYGIGTMGRDAYDFVDMLKRAGQKYWQVLPIGPTSFGDSPYQSFSAFAGNPYFIDMDTLIAEGILKKEEVESYKWADSDDEIDYARIYRQRFEVLRKAFGRSEHKDSRDYADFIKENEQWIDDYALYMAIKADHNNREWLAGNRRSRRESRRQWQLTEKSLVKRGNPQNFHFKFLPAVDAIKRVRQQKWNKHHR